MQSSNPGFDWNDARYLLAVARHGGTQSAARALGVNSSTVQRRIAELERCFGQALVVREQAGYRLTAFGEQLVPLVERMERAAQALAQQVRATAHDVAGVVRVTLPDPLVYRFTHSMLLERFRALHPQVQVEFVMTDAYLDLGQGQADIALRAGASDESLVGRPIGEAQWGVYASRAYLQRHAAPASMDELAQHALVGLDDSKAGHKASQWLRHVAPGASLVARSNTVLGLVYSVKSGTGIAPLPVSLGDSEPDLVRVLGPVPELAQTWYLLTTRELRQVPRVAALFDFLVEEIVTLRSVLFDPIPALTAPAG